MISDLDHRAEGHAEEIHGVYLAAYGAEAQLLEVDDFPPLQRTVEEIRGASSSFVGWRDADRLVAVIELVDGHGGDGPELEIAGLAVHPDVFRRGIASSLLEHVLEKHSGWQIRVSTAWDNQPALRLYAKMGFEIEKSWLSPEGIGMVGLAHELGAG